MWKEEGGNVTKEGPEQRTVGGCEVAQERYRKSGTRLSVQSSISPPSPFRCSFKLYPR